MLYLVPTPIGNLDDISYRAVKVLAEVDYILSEDTRTTQSLLGHYQISNDIRSFHDHNEHGRLPSVIADLKSGKEIALVSEAGMPGISDPGFLPHKKGRQTRLKYLATLPHTFILYESPHRFIKCLDELITYCGSERHIAVCRELTKKFEEVHTGSLMDQKAFYEGKGVVKGEFVIVVSGKEG